MKYDDIFSRLDRMHERDRRTDTWPQQRPCLRIASRGKNENYLARLKGQSLLKKNLWKRHQNRPINSDTKPAQSIPFERTAHRPQSVTKKTRNQKHRPNTGDNAYRQDSVIPPGVDLITISIVTIQSIWHNSVAYFLRFGKFPPQIGESCGGIYLRN